MELSGYLAIAKRWWWTLIVSAWIAGVAGYIVASGLPPTYESQAKVLVGPINTDSDTLRASSALVQTYAQVVTTDSVLQSALKENGLSMSLDDFRTATRATANDVTRILTIRVQAGDPNNAAKLANSLATELEQLTSQGVSRPEGLIQVVEFAQPSPANEPVAPQVSLITILAALAGIVMAIVIVLIVEYFGRAIRTGEELASVGGAPLLATVGVAHGDRPRPSDLVVESEPNARAASAYRLAAAKVAFAEDGHQRRSFVVTDVDWEGQSAVVATNLASALARLGRAVVLIDAAGRSGTVTALHGLTDEAGLSEVLNGDVSPTFETDDGPGVQIMGAGRAPLDVVDPARVQLLVDELLASGRMVVIAIAPVRDEPQALAFARAVDGVVVVGRTDRTNRDDVQFVGESMRLVGATVVGVVVAQKGGFLEGARRPRDRRRERPEPRRVELAPPGAVRRRARSSAGSARVAAVATSRPRGSSPRREGSSATGQLPI